jgi:hypothetical protein
VQEFARINGVGERKLEAYGDRFLEVIRRYVTERKGQPTGEDDVES